MNFYEDLSKSNTFQYLTKRYLLFIKILLEPWLVILSIALIVTICYLIDNNLTPLKDYLFILISILSSVWSGIASNLWLKFTEEKIIEARGKNAIRSLNLLNSIVDKITSRIYKFKSDCNIDQKNTNVILANFDEIDSLCDSIKNIGYNSIEDWQDIIPEADLKQVINNVIEKLKKEKDSKEEEIKLLQERLVIVESSNNEEKTNLEEQIKQKSIRISQLSSQLSNCQNSVATGSYYGLMNNQCQSCGCEYSSLNVQCDPQGCRICPNCKCRI